MNAGKRSPVEGIHIEDYRRQTPLKNAPKRKPSLWFIIFVVILIGAFVSVFVYPSVRGVIYTAQLGDAKEATAVITSLWQRGEGSNFYNVHYTFDVPLADGGTETYDGNDYMRIGISEPRSGEITIVYNPDNPHISLIEARSAAGDWVSLLCAAGAFFMGGVLLVYFLLARKYDVSRMMQDIADKNNAP